MILVINIVRYCSGCIMGVLIGALAFIAEALDLEE